MPRLIGLPDAEACASSITAVVPDASSFAPGMIVPLTMPRWSRCAEMRRLPAFGSVREGSRWRLSCLGGVACDRRRQDQRPAGICREPGDVGGRQTWRGLGAAAPLLRGRRAAAAFAEILVQRSEAGVSGRISSLTCLSIAAPIMGRAEAGSVTTTMSRARHLVGSADRSRANGRRRSGRRRTAA